MPIGAMTTTTTTTTTEPLQNKNVQQVMAIRTFTNFRQNSKSNSDYLKEFRAKELLVNTLFSGTPNSLKIETKNIAVLFLMNSDDRRYKGLKTDLHNQSLLGNDNYPKDLEHALKLLDGYKENKSNNAPVNSC